jgi:hypothetical protein
MGWVWAAIFAACAFGLARLLPRIWKSGEVAG